MKHVDNLILVMRPFRPNLTEFKAGIDEKGWIANSTFRSRPSAFRVRGRTPLQSIRFVGGYDLI